MQTETVPFTFKKVELTDTKLMTEIYRLRFQVYCRECGFIKAEDYPEGLESDNYDKQSMHFIALDKEENIVGTMRMILPGELPLPLETHCPDLNIDKNSIPSSQVAEVSRLVISKGLRRRQDDGTYYGPRAEDEKGTDASGHEFIRRAKPMAFGLYRELYKESKKLGITHWYALMEKSLWLLLRIHGLIFEPIGKECDVFGPVKPYLGKLYDIEKTVAKRFPKFFSYFIQD